MGGINHPQIGLWLGCPQYCVYFEDSKLVMYSLYSILWSFQIAHSSGFYGTFIPDLPIHPGDVSYQPFIAPGGNIKVIDSDLFASIWDLEMVVSVPQDHSKHFNSANNSAGVWFQMATNGYNGSSFRPTIGFQRDIGVHRRSPPCPTCIARLIPAMKRDLSSLPSQCPNVRWRRNCSFAEDVFFFRFPVLVVI